MTQHRRISGKLVIATHNPGKLAEMRELLAPHGVEAISAGDLGLEEPEETGETFRANASVKALAAAKAAQLPAFADDSGLAVDALNGMPGVFSARWAGGHGDDQANLDLVLAQIGDVSDEHRGGAFVCAAALVLPNGREHLVEGRQTGRILRSRRGEGGFGYDPIFLGDGQTRTNAELSPAEKDAISHRGKAFRELSKVIVCELRAGSATAPGPRSRG
jgi:XTP/dITP diphosphohydrolase